MEARRLGFELTPDRIRKICDRHTGVGSDGILLVVEPTQADFAVRILNPDGSEAEKSGNGLRIFAKFLYDHGYTKKTVFTIQTLGGVVKAKLLLGCGRVAAVCVDMGKAVIDRALGSLQVAGQTLEVTSLSVGNPHCVIVVPDLSAADKWRLGPAIETHPAFPNRTNVQFAQVQSGNSVKAWIWERGAGHTLASGSSACAVAVACYDKGLVGNPVAVHMEGGDLQIEVDKQLNLVMTGPAEEICAGSLSDDLKRRLTTSSD
jgi:diaminopimelate epimerase